MPDRAATEEILRASYRAFNAHDVDAAIALMHPHVDWPNAWKGGRVIGREEVAAYWRRQFESISSTVEPEAFEHGPDGSVTVLVRQVVEDATTRRRISDVRIRHRYRIEDRLIVRMDVLDDEA